MINVTFPDNTKKQFKKNITGLEIAYTISNIFAKDALVVEIDNVLQDLDFPISNDCSLKILTYKDSRSLEVLRHNAFHIMAAAVKVLFPNVQIVKGCTTNNGFFYDFASDIPLTCGDLVTIEQKMREIITSDLKIIKKLFSRDRAIELFKSINEYYKVEIILKTFNHDQNITLYKYNEFIDFCFDCHLLSTRHIKYFKLTKVSGVYWCGNSNNAMLQRIYGTLWATQEQIDNYFFEVEESQKRDHRKLGQELDLFHFQEESQGMVFWHHNGWTIYSIIKQYMRNKIKKNGYIEVHTPILIDKTLWQDSGHWTKFKDNMFLVNFDDSKIFAMKPMNCPCHVQIFKHSIKSYRDLPLRMFEFGLCHRNESSGALHGLMRVKAFQQDDAHIFCTEQQITSETIKYCTLVNEVYQDFGFYDIKIKFSDRPKIRAGSDEIWDKAEKALKSAIETGGYSYTLNSGDGAFYGPKLDFYLKDSIGREWQCGTLQVDFILPKRLNAYYINIKGIKTTPIMLHRAIIGSFERFIGILIEEYKGKFPIWLSPIQVSIATITNDFNDYGLEVHNLFINHGIRSDLDISSDKINCKIHRFICKKIPIIAVIGKNELANNTLSIRYLEFKKQEIISVKNLIALIQKHNNQYLL